MADGEIVADCVLGDRRGADGFSRQSRLSTKIEDRGNA
jgi:hypothetical protein